MEVGCGECNWHGGCKHVSSTCRGRCVPWGLGMCRWASVYGVVSVVAGTCRMTMFDRGTAVGSWSEGESARKGTCTSTEMYSYPRSEPSASVENLLQKALATLGAG